MNEQNNPLSEVSDNSGTFEENTDKAQSSPENMSESNSSFAESGYQPQPPPPPVWNDNYDPVGNHTENSFPSDADDGYEKASDNSPDPFAEQDFGSAPSGGQIPQADRGYIPFGAAPNQPGNIPPRYIPPQFSSAGYAPPPFPSQYGGMNPNGGMYGNETANANMYGGTDRGVYPGAAFGGYNGNYPPPPPSPVYTDYGSPEALSSAAAPAPAKKRLSTAGTVAVAVTVSALFMGLMIILGITSSETNTVNRTQDQGSSVSESQNIFEQFVGADNTSENDSSVTKVTLPVKSKPVQEEKYYQDESTGLLTVAGVAKTILPSVVEIEIFGDTTLYPISRASGIIVSDDGYIITNAHVVSDAVSGVRVTLEDGRDFDAEIIGQDSRTDIAVIKIDGSDLVPAEIGDSSELELGEMVTAVGNCEGFTRSVSVGYVSGLDREIVTSNSDGYKISCIQTDAAMSPGISGGALVNMYGQVVGITTLKHKTSELDEGINFAISSNFAVPIIEDIISKGYIEGRIRIGIMYLPLSSEEAEYYGVERGLYIDSVAPDCDISNTRLSSGDIITSINGIEVYNENTITEALKDLRPGDIITAHVFRKGITDSSNEEFDIEFKVMQDKNLN